MDRIYSIELELQQGLEEEAYISLQQKVAEAIASLDAKDLITDVVLVDKTKVTAVDTQEASCDEDCESCSISTN